MTMLQKIAEAICIRRNKNDWPCNGLDFDTEMAKVAIEAMREPTQEMLIAFYGTTPKEQWLGKDWQDMIDEALK